MLIMASCVFKKYTHFMYAISMSITFGGLVHSVITAVSSCVQLSSCVQRALFPVVVHCLWIYTLSTPLSKDPEVWGGGV